MSTEEEATTDVVVQWRETCTYQAMFRMTPADAEHIANHSPDECDDNDDCPAYRYIIDLDRDEFDEAFSSTDERWITYYSTPQQKEAP